MRALHDLDVQALMTFYVKAWANS